MPPLGILPEVFFCGGREMRCYGSGMFGGRAGVRMAQGQVATGISSELQAMLGEWRAESVDDPYRTESDDDEGRAKGGKGNEVKKAVPKAQRGKRDQGQVAASEKSGAETKGGWKTVLEKRKGDDRKGEELGAQGGGAREGARVSDESEGGTMVQVITVSVVMERQLLDLLHEYGLQVLPSPQTPRRSTAHQAPASRPLIHWAAGRVVCCEDERASSPACTCEKVGGGGRQRADCKGPRS